MALASGLTACASPPLTQSSVGVTEDEYRLAFEDYRTCMEEHGYALVHVEENGEVIEYAYVEDATTTGVESLCYAPFHPIDAAWQIQNEDVSRTADLYRLCLRRVDIPPAPTMSEMHQQLLDAGIDPLSCIP